MQWHTIVLRKVGITYTRRQPCYIEKEKNESQGNEGKEKKEEGKKDK